MSNLPERCKYEDILLFEFRGMRIRTILDEAGDPWFIAKDICEALGLSNVSKALRGLDRDEKANITIGNFDNKFRKMKAVDESGLYHLIFKSQKPEAQEFRRWVTKEVLPAIRKTGTYSVIEHAGRELAKDELVRLLLLGAPAEWEKQFPEEFWTELARLRRWYKYSAQKHNTPADAGRWVSWIIYQRLPSPVYETLKERNPIGENGQRANNHHQFMTPDNGLEILANLIRESIRFMKTSVDWKDFEWRWNQIRPCPGQQLKMFATTAPQPLPSAA